MDNTRKFHELQKAVLNATTEAELFTAIYALFEEGVNGSVPMAMLREFILIALKYYGDRKRDPRRFPPKNIVIKPASVINNKVITIPADNVGFIIESDSYSMIALRSGNGSWQITKEEAERLKKELGWTSSVKT